jgi:hypothetical protein
VRVDTNEYRQHMKIADRKMNFVRAFIAGEFFADIQSVTSIIMLIARTWDY